MAVLPADTFSPLVLRQTMPVAGQQFAYPRARDIHIVAIVPSTLSFLSALIGIYWFCTMQRNFRLSLILTLVIADASKSLWIFIFSIVGLVRSDGIASHSAFCQVGGFLLQMSFEACDLSIFFLTMHVTLQILSPRWIPGSRDGLYAVRKWVLMACFVLPMIDALIPFSRLPSNTGYTFDGAYCSLYLEPAAYTLALSWVPRYLCWLTVLLCILCVYTYTKSQAFSRRDSMTSQPASVQSRSKPIAIMSYISCTGPKRRNRNESAPSIDPEPSTGGQRRGSEFSTFTVHRQNSRPQIKKLLLYPVVYIILWSPPFAAQVISYSTSRNVNSVYGLREASVFCVSSLGFFDVVIFCWREKPWKYNSRGDGTCAGSFRLPFSMPSPFSSRRPSVDPTVELDVDAVTPALEPARPHRTYNKGTDSNRRHALLAYERLAMERAEAVMRPQMRRATNSRNLALTLTANTVNLPGETDFEMVFDSFDQDSPGETPIVPSDLMNGTSPSMLGEESTVLGLEPYRG